MHDCILTSTEVMDIASRMYLCTFVHGNTLFAGCGMCRWCASGIQDYCSASPIGAPALRTAAAKGWDQAACPPKEICTRRAPLLSLMQLAFTMVKVCDISAVNSILDR